MIIVVPNKTPVQHDHIGTKQNTCNNKSREKNEIR